MPHVSNGAQLTLATWLEPRPDRPATIPLPPDVTVRIGRVDGQAPADSAGVHVVGLNSREHSTNKDLLSRRHAEISWQGAGALVFRDGNPLRAPPAPSCNGSSIDDVLVPLAGECEAPLGCTIELGVPHLIPGRKPLPPPREFVYRLEGLPATGAAASVGAAGSSASRSQAALP